MTNTNEEKGKYTTITIMIQEEGLKRYIYTSGKVET